MEIEVAMPRWYRALVTGASSEIRKFLGQDAETMAAGKARVVPGALNRMAVGFLKVAPLRSVRPLDRTELG